MFIIKNMGSKKIISRYWLIFALLIFFFLRVPSLFEPFTYGDEGIYLALGQAANKGLVWYKEIHDNKPPMLYLVAALANNFTTYRLIYFGWSLVTILGFWQLAKLLFPKNTSAQAGSTLAFTVLTNLHRFEGNVANAENLMIFLTLAGMYYIFEQLATKTKKRQGPGKTSAFLYTAGSLLGMATLFKVPAAFDLIAALAFIAFSYKSRKNLAQLFSDSLYLTAGFLSPILISFAYYGFKGALSEYLTAAFFQNLPYLSSWAQDKPQTGGLPLAMLFRGTVVLGVNGLIFLFREKISPAAKLVVTWFSFSWFAALLSSRPYPHYLVQILPALSLSFGLLFVKIKNCFCFSFKKSRLSLETLIPVILLVIFQISFSIFHFWTYSNREYYLNFYRYALGKQNQTEYLENFDPKAKTIYQAANYLRQRTDPDERIFIWGTEPSIYPLANRLPLGRYTTSYHIIDFNGYQETIDQINDNPPRFIVVSPEEKRPFPKLFGLIQKKYILAKTIDNLQIYHLNPSYD